MQPTPEVLAAAENTRKAYKESPVWAPALDGTDIRTPAASVEPLRPDDIHYFLFEFTRKARVTARFAISQNSALLEAEGVKQASARLQPFLDAETMRWWAAGRSLRQVWTPCNETTRRLRPLWEVSANGITRYIRADGVIFERLTTSTGRG